MAVVYLHRRGGSQYVAGRVHDLPEAIAVELCDEPGPEWREEPYGVRIPERFGVKPPRDGMRPPREVRAWLDGEEDDTDTDRADELDAFTVDELKDQLHALGLSKAGKKSDLIDRLLEHESEE